MVTVANFIIKKFRPISIPSRFRLLKLTDMVYVSPVAGAINIEKKETFKNRSPDVQVSVGLTSINSILTLAS